MHNKWTSGQPWGITANNGELGLFLELQFHHLSTPWAVHWKIMSTCKDFKKVVTHIPATVSTYMCVNTRQWLLAWSNIPCIVHTLWTGSTLPAWSSVPCLTKKTHKILSRVVGKPNARSLTVFSPCSHPRSLSMIDQNVLKPLLVNTNWWSLNANCPEIQIKTSRLQFLLNLCQQCS